MTYWWRSCFRYESLIEISRKNFGIFVKSLTMQCTTIKSCFFLSAHPCSPRQRAVKRVCYRVALYQYSERKRTWPRPVAYPICRSVGRSVCLCVRKLYCGKTADWIRMPFGMVSGVGRGMDVLDAGGDRRREGDSFVGKCGAFHCKIETLRRALPKLLCGGLVV